MKPIVNKLIIILFATMFLGMSSVVLADNVKKVEVVNKPVVKAKQKGDWNVGVLGEVKVATDPANPLEVKNQTPSRLPFDINLTVPAWNGLQASVDFTVPSDKLLVIEYVSVNTRSSTPIFEGIIYFSPSGVRHNFNVPCVEWNPTQYRCFGGQQMRVYADPSEIVYLKVQGSGYGYGAQFSASGYLLPLDADSLAP